MSHTGRPRRRTIAGEERLVPTCARPDADDRLSAAQATAFEAIAAVVAGHLRSAVADHAARAQGGLTSEDMAPRLIQVDGRANSEFVRRLARRLDDGVDGVDWTVLRFDAWKYQRVQPPWWWLLAELDRQLRAEFGPRRVADLRWRAREVVRGLWPVALCAAVGVLLWVAAGHGSMGSFLAQAGGVVGGATALGALLWSGVKLLPRLLLTSPVTVGVGARVGDPMAEMQRRYAFLMRSAGTPVAVVIDHLDRCGAAYVVELLEGIQTMLKDLTAAGAVTHELVAFIVPADRTWLCESYASVYGEFSESAREPGRPFGMNFVDRVFDDAVRLPGAYAPWAVQPASEGQRQMLARAGSERAVRALLAERGSGGWRMAAVRRLGEIDVDSETGLCGVAEAGLRELVGHVDASNVPMARLRTAYCVQRTAQLVGGHAIDCDEDAVHRLGLWTLLSLRWPVLARHLARHPQDVAALRAGCTPDGVGDELRAVFEAGEAGALADGWGAVSLGEREIRRFSRPLGRRDTPPARAAALAAV
jgi:hypothetical protein